MNSKTKCVIRKIGIVLFAAYVFLLMYFLFFSEGYGRIPWEGREYRYNLRPFREIRRFWDNRRQLGNMVMFMNLFGNVIGFIPFGFILPVIAAKMRNVFMISLSGAAVSLCVETIQLCTRVGCFDVDDLILNTLGAFLGYLLFAFCNWIRRKYDGKKI